MTITAKTGTGTTLTWASGFTCKIINVDPFAMALEAIEAINMEAVDYIPKIPADLVDLGVMSMEIEYEPDAAPPIGVVQLVTVNPKGLGAGKLIKGTGFISGFVPTIPVNAKMTAQIEFTWDGDQFDTGAS